MNLQKKQENFFSGIKNAGGAKNNMQIVCIIF